MRILWFSNTPSLSANHFGYKGIGGGWIESLEIELSKLPNIQLGICFNVIDNRAESFVVNNTTYYPIEKKQEKGKLRRIIAGWDHKTERSSNFQYYLDVIQKFRPDLIHIFGTESEFGLITSMTKIPCVIYIQGNLNVINHKWFSGIPASDVFRYSKKWTLLKGRGLFHDYYKNLRASNREKIIFRGCRFFIGRTDWDRRITAVLSPGSEYFHCDEIMRSGFYMNQWKPKPIKTRLIIVSTIRNSIYKGLETILECAILLMQSFHNYEIIWKVVGISGDDEISCLLERKYRSKFKDNGIYLSGPFDENRLIAEMLRADLYIHPSHTDNSPNSICEAMLLGMPIIATFSGGIPSIITDKKECLLVQDGDPFALAGAILELIKDQDYAQRLGDNARERALVRHNPNRIVNDLLGTYKTLISRANI
jgi:glycosyltransferase involved in cell wall biosynthesis